ncbi:hypothetical protein GCM10022630_30980 [Thermobifida alba]
MVDGGWAVVSGAALIGFRTVPVGGERVAVLLSEPGGRGGAGGLLLCFYLIGGSDGAGMGGRMVGGGRCGGCVGRPGVRLFRRGRWFLLPGAQLRRGLCAPVPCLGQRGACLLASLLRSSAGGAVGVTMRGVPARSRVRRSGVTLSMPVDVWGPAGAARRWVR